MEQEALRVQMIKKRYEKKWLRMKGVTAIGVGLADGEPVIIVSMQFENEKVRQRIPEIIENVPVRIEITGPIKAQ